MKAKLYTDGGSRGNPGPAACAFVLENTDGSVIDTNGKFIGEETNNVAEYSGLIMGLISARHHNVSELYVVSDSELMIRQIQGVYKVKDLRLRELYNMVQNTIPLFNKIDFIAVPREQNTLADQIVNQILDEQLKH